MARKRARGGDESFVIDTHGDVDEESAPESPASEPDVHIQGSEPAPGAFAGLDLPGHVEVVGNEQENPADASGDYEQLDAAGGARYYDADDGDRIRTVCTVCGEVGHDKKKCPHTHCLACGAVDEHATRNCPLGTTCFRCGGVGHRANSCPRPRAESRRFCERCGRHTHPSTNCPTLWRIYSYCTPEEHYKLRARKAFVSTRRAERRAARHNSSRRSGWAAAVVVGSDDSASESGEEEPPPDWDPARTWCYNCASDEHWGDDCHLRRANPTRPTGEPSAFSRVVADSGPFGPPRGAPPHARGAPPPRGAPRKRAPPPDMDREVAADDWFSRRQALARQRTADDNEPLPPPQQPRTLKERLGGWASQARDVLRPRKIRRSSGKGRGRGRAPFAPQYRGGYA